MNRQWLRWVVGAVVAPLVPLALIVLAIFIDLARGPVQGETDVPIQAYPHFFGMLHSAYGIAVLVGAFVVAIPAVRSLFTGKTLMASVPVAAAFLSYALRPSQGVGGSTSMLTEYALLFAGFVLVVGLWAWVLFLFIRPRTS